MLIEHSSAIRCAGIALALVLTSTQVALCEEQPDVKGKWEQIRQQSLRINGKAPSEEDITRASTVDGAAGMKQSPTLCIRSYENALQKATSLDQLFPYFSTRYQQSILGKLSSAEKGNQLITLKSAYAFKLDGHQGPAMARESVSNDGQVNVHLEGKNAWNGKWKGVEVRFKMVPESGYWKIDDYKAKTGLQLLRISIPQERPGH